MSFEHVAWRPLPYSMGVPIGSDWQDKAADDPIFGLYTTCGFWSNAETTLLTQISAMIQGRWIEIGAHTGWCTSILGDYADFVVSIEPMFSLPEWYRRFAKNVQALDDGVVMPWAGLSNQYFAIWDGAGGRTFDGVLIDGDHAGGNPLMDARNAYDRLNPRAVVLLHDFRGPEVWDAAKYLVDQGMQFKVYPSVNMVCVCWRGEFNPPDTFQEGETDWVKHYGLPEWAK
jgi:hypothetical protein